jgi:superfamily I DNA/RNA helicase
MDTIEVSRQRAEQLHYAATSCGDDACEPYAFTCTEAKRRNLAVERVPKNDVRLHGARALYDPDALLILHEDTGDAFSNAFYVAHEIGHVEFGGADEFTSTSEADPLRSAEVASIGVDRVVDYNRKQRREIQMDLFAREFLLPRRWMRQLHVDGNKTASSIASQCKAPFSVVAQQLFDSLLLPPVVIPLPKAVVSRPLNEDQRKAVNHRGRPYLLEAGPGTGKTQTLVARVNSLLTDGVSPEKVLVLTFSNKAAGELSERITLQHPEAVSGMWIGTFHAFGLDLVRRFHERLGLPVEPRLIDRTDAIELLENEYPRLELIHFKNLWDPSQPLNLVLNAISRSNDEVVNAARYRELAVTMRKTATTPEENDAAQRSLEVATVFEAYEKAKLEKGCIDFGDLVAMPVRLCDTFQDVREHLANLYEHVFVDEFQDVNRSSIRLLNAITNGGENLWAVGDAKQSIYRFRGASSFNMSRFGRDDFSGGERGRLSINYRSVAEVRDAFLHFASGMQVVNGADCSLEADRGQGGHLPEHRAVGTDDQEIATVAESIEEMRASGHSFRNQAVLCSGNERLGRFAQGLERLGIPVLCLGSLFERPEIKDLLCLLSVVVDRRAMGLLRISAITKYTVSLADVACILSHLKEHEFEPLQWASGLHAIEGLTPEGIESLTRVGELLDGFGITADPWTLLATFLLDRSRLAAEIASDSDIRARSRGIAIWQLMNFLRNQPPGKGLPIVRVLERIRKLVLHADERDLRQLPAAAQSIDAVRLMTMHGSKGLEFEVVHIPGMTAASLPRSPNSLLAQTIIPPDGLIEGAAASGASASRDAMIEEQECLFFVALSRARDRLFLYYPTINSNGSSRPRSPFIARLGDTARARQIVPSVELPPAEGGAPISITIDGSFSFSDHQLALYERCPRRFFYTHILAIGGRRTESAFMRLHVAVQQVVDGISQGTDDSPALAVIEELLSAAWETHGPSDHGYSDDYKRIAWQLIRFFLDSASAMKRLPTPRLRLPIAGGEIIITPDQVLADAAGRIHMRRVRTGHKRSKDEENLAAAAFHIAATAHSPGCTVQLVYLSDGAVTPLSMTSRVLGNRADTISKMLVAVKAYSQLDGAMSLVLPNHARARPLFEQAGVHVRTPERWEQLTPDAAAAAVRVVPSYFDFRTDMEQPNERPNIQPPRKRPWWAFFAFWKR